MQHEKTIHVCNLKHAPTSLLPPPLATTSSHRLSGPFEIVFYETPWNASPQCLLHSFWTFLSNISTYSGLWLTFFRCSVSVLTRRTSNCQVGSRAVMSSNTDVTGRLGVKCLPVTFITVTHIFFAFLEDKRGVPNANISPSVVSGP